MKWKMRVSGPQRWQLLSPKSLKMEEYGHETERTAETKSSFG